ncbi:sugar diacid recognition domain-containing protein [Jeotgalibacillus sp. R-1-5s-1]|uniref:CdaR family transcriptional regulator n=1 Tax=Jeotgalibacillus sp. R-1-5s-1 TaxID=2555897 RepID=UPI00106A3D50|nr:sugar diacid recognition domain-containing protein [Jeotgalibacillus sp. R-1-5s-1]TFE00063.1 hypothetical protein E2491_06370 [Jeotgalibacillus sp. R-1-5s-1]
MLYTKEIAQKIVSDTMKVIPYNINIFDHNGRVLASGDPKRLDQLHQGALLVLHENKTIEITDQTMPGTLKGINMPLVVNGECIGVIGITGEVAEVRPFASMVKSHIELLIQQQALQTELERQKRILDYFFIDLFSGRMTESEAADKARLLSIPVDQETFLIVFRCSQASEFPKVRQALDHSPFCLLTAQIRSEEGIALLTRTEPFIAMAKDMSCPFSTTLEKASLHDYRTHYSIARKLLDHRVDAANLFCTPKDLTLQTLLRQAEPDMLQLFTKNTAKTLRDYPDLIETFMAYIHHDFIISKTAHTLKIQRATVMARLQKIDSMTGLNSKNALDCFRLYSALILLNEHND